MNEILSVLSCQLRAVKPKFSRINLSLAVLTAFLIFLLSFMVKELRYYCCAEVKKVFYSLPSDNLHDVFHGTHDLILRKSDLEVPSLKAEAVNSLNIAVELKNAGKLDKAMKVMQHCVSLAPFDPDVLNSYGQFLEDIKKDIVTADQMYFQALVKNPSHEQALTNRMRTAVVVEEMDRMWLRKIDEKRNKVASIPETNVALSRAKKEAYFQHIYHTVGIEGNTMSLSQTRSIVETRMAIGGKSLAEHNEILGLDAALKYINATLINRIGRISVEDILEIHRRVLGYVDPTEGGMFRRTQVFVGGHIPPGPNHIPLLMDEFSNWLNSDTALRIHPIKLAALAHYKLVHIHPFIDGNGRTSRLLMNMILMQAGFPPVIIPKQERHRYYQMLEYANEGDIRPFVRFIAECTEKTLDLFLWSTSEYASSKVPALEFYGDTHI